MASGLYDFVCLRQIALYVCRLSCPPALLADQRQMKRGVFFALFACRVVALAKPGASAVKKNQRIRHHNYK